MVGRQRVGGRPLSRGSCSVSPEAQGLLSQCLVLGGELLPLPPDPGELLGQDVQPLPQLPDLVPGSVPLSTDLSKTSSQLKA